jgi:hypothetical protein
MVADYLIILLLFQLEKPSQTLYHLCDVYSVCGDVTQVERGDIALYKTFTMLLILKKTPYSISVKYHYINNEK